MKQKQHTGKFIKPRDIVILAVVLFIAFLFNSGLINFNLLTRASVVPANIVVETQQVGDLTNTDFYHAFAQGGEERKDMLAAAISDVKQLSPRIIRLDHIYDYFPVVNRIDGLLVFDFSSLDLAVNSILQTGATPMLSLSYMPPAIARDGNILNEPEKWEEWSLVVQRTIEHFSGSNNRNLTGMYYEVWNEPDLAQFGGWGIRGSKSYITLYRYAALGASQAARTNPFSLGGPASTGFYPNWVKALVESGIGADFISWHGYLQKPEQYAADMQSAHTIISQYPQYANVPLLITEFGFTGAHDKRYGTSYAAAHAAASIRQLIDRPPRYLFSFELIDGPSQESGEGWGLLEHEPSLLHKPRFEVFRFLDLMSGRRLDLRGEGSDVTGWAVTDSGIHKLLLVNFSADRQIGQKVPILFNGLTPGTYRLRQKYFLGADGTQTIEIPATSYATDTYLPASGILLVMLEKK
jgi:hypothetical protein